MVSSSVVVLRTAPSTWSTSTRTSAMRISLSKVGAGSDELLGGEELGELQTAVALVLDHLPVLARRPRRDLLDRRPGRGQPDLPGLDAEVGQTPGLHRLLLGGHDPLEGGVPRLVDLVGHA